MDEVRRWFDEARAEEAAKNLIRHGFDAIKLPDRKAACDELLRRIPREKTVGVGGSVTLREIGLIDQLKAGGNILYDHWTPGLSPDESLKSQKGPAVLRCLYDKRKCRDLDGEIVNVDGFCNRISAMAFGPEEVIMMAGKNKLVQDVPEALHGSRISLRR